MTTSNDFREQILAKAAEDADFRSSLLDDPSAAIGSELNFDFPSSLSIQVHEDGPNTVNLVLPPKVELPESELGQIVGGADVDSPGYPFW